MSWEPNSGSAVPVWVGFLLKYLSALVSLKCFVCHFLKRPYSSKDHSWQFLAGREGPWLPPRVYEPAEPAAGSRMTGTSAVVRVHREDSTAPLWLSQGNASLA